MSCATRGPFWRFADGLLHTARVALRGTPFRSPLVAVIRAWGPAQRNMRQPSRPPAWHGRRAKARIAPVRWHCDRRWRAPAPTSADCRRPAADATCSGARSTALHAAAGRPAHLGRSDPPLRASAAVCGAEPPPRRPRCYLRRPGARARRAARDRRRRRHGPVDCHHLGGLIPRPCLPARGRPSAGALGLRPRAPAEPPDQGTVVSHLFVAGRAGHGKFVPLPSNHLRGAKQRPSLLRPPGVLLRGTARQRSTACARTGQRSVRVI